MTLPIVAIILIIVSSIALVLSFLIKRWRAFLLLTSFFALLNSFIAAPQSWISLFTDRGLQPEDEMGDLIGLIPLSPTSPPVPVNQRALPTDTPEAIIQKMGCFVCHMIPHIPQARSSNLGPLLVSKTTAFLRIASPEYQARLKAGKASATTPRDYVIESILNPNAFIVPGYERKENPEESPMYQHYAERFTSGGLQTLVAFLLTLDVEAAAKEGLIFTHGASAEQTSP